MQDLGLRSCALYCAFEHFGEYGRDHQKDARSLKDFCDLDEVMQRYGQSNDNGYKQALHALSGKVDFERNQDFSSFDTIAYPGGGSDNFRVADLSGLEEKARCRLS